MFLISLCTVLIIFTLTMATSKQRVYECGISGIDGRWKIVVPTVFFVMVIAILTLTSGVRHGFIDTYAYKDMYELTRNDLEYVNSAPFGVEAGWLYFCYYLNFISPNPVLMLMVTGFTVNFAFVTAIKKYSCDPVFSIFLYFCLLYLSTNNGVRQMVAGAIVIIALPLLMKKKVSCYILYAIIILLLTGFHKSVMVALAVAVLVVGKAMNIKMIIACASSVVLMLVPSLMSSLLSELFAGDKYSMYIDGNIGMSFLRAFIIGIIPLVLTIMYMYLCKKKNRQIEYKEGILLNIIILNSIFVVLGLRMQYWARLCFYTSYANFIIIPKLIYEVFNKQDRKIIRGIACVCYFFFFAYNIYVNVGYGAMDSFYIDLAGA